MLWLEIVLEVPLLLIDWLVSRLEAPRCPECGAQLYRVKSARRAPVLLCRQCERYYEQGKALSKT